MELSDYARYDGLALAELVRGKQVTAAEVLEAAIARADQVNPAINAIIHRMDAAARADAGRATLGAPFAGVPFLVKDLVQLVKGEPYRAGSRFLGDFVPDHDTELMSRFRRDQSSVYGLGSFTSDVVIVRNCIKKENTGGIAARGRRTNPLFIDHRCLWL